MVEVSGTAEVADLDFSINAEDLWDPKERLQYFLDNVQDASDKWGIKCTLTITIELTPCEEEEEED